MYGLTGGRTDKKVEEQKAGRKSWILALNVLSGGLFITLSRIYKIFERLRLHCLKTSLKTLVWRHSLLFQYCIINTGLFVIGHCPILITCSPILLLILDYTWHVNFGKHVESELFTQSRMECSPEHVCHLLGPCQKFLIFDRKVAITLI